MCYQGNNAYEFRDKTFKTPIQHLALGLILTGVCAQSEALKQAELIIKNQGSSVRPKLSRNRPLENSQQPSAPPLQLDQQTSYHTVTQIGAQNNNEYAQQKQAISLLNNLSPFTGNTSIDGVLSQRFDIWIRTFENVRDMATWTEDRKIKILASKLSSMAAESFRQTKPQEIQKYKLIKEMLIKRFHGSET